MTPDLDAIERLARDATPGPYIVDAVDKDGDYEIRTRDGTNGSGYTLVIPFLHRESDARFFAALSPDVVLALVAMARKGGGS